LPSSSFLLACLAGFGLWWLESRGKVSTDDAYIDGDIYLVTPRIDGYAEKVLVEDNQPVEAGQLLVAIDPLPFEVAVSQARAELAQAEATLAGLTLAVPLERTQTGFKVAEAEAELAKLMKDRDKARNDAEAALKSQSSIAADLRQAGIDFDRMQKLFQKGAVSADEYDKAETKVRTLGGRPGPLHGPGPRGRERPGRGREGPRHHPGADQAGRHGARVRPTSRTGRPRPRRPWSSWPGPSCTRPSST